MFDHMLIVAPAAIFLVALALIADLPQRLLNGLARLRPRRLTHARSD
jgi:hypothetical protein